MLRTAKKLEQARLCIRIPSVNLDKACLVAFSDASFGNMPRHGSQGGFVLLVADRAVASQPAPAAVVEWRSHRLKRVVKSTLAAEAAALCEAQGHIEFGRVL